MFSRMRLPCVVVLVSLLELGAGPVIVEDQNRGRGIALSRGEECFVLTPAHIVSTGSRRPDAEVRVIGANQVTGTAQFSATVGTEDDDVALLRVTENARGICSDAETAKIRRLESPTLVLRESSGALSYVPVGVVLDERRTIAVRSQSEFTPLAQMMSGALLVVAGQERGILIAVSTDEGNVGEVRNLGYVAGLLGSWAGGSSGEFGDVRDAWALVENAVEHKPTGDIGQIGAVEQLVRAGLGFEGMALEGLVLRGASIADARFDETELAGADFSQANLERASFERAKMPFADLNGSSAPAARFVGAYLPYASAEKANLSGVDLERSNWFAARMQGAVLKEANLRGASLMLADLRGADLRGADLTNAVLFGAVLDGARLEGATWDNTDVSSSVGIPQELGLTHPAVCARRSDEIAAFKLSIFEVTPSTRYDSGFSYDELSTYWISPTIPTGSTFHVDLCQSVDESETAVFGTPVSNDEIYTQGIRFRLSNDLLSTAGRKGIYLRRIREHTEFLKEHVRPDRFLRVGSRRLSRLVADIEARVSPLRRPEVDCLDPDTLDVLLASRQPLTPELLSWLISERRDHEGETRRAIERASAGAWELDEGLPWGTFFPEGFDRRDLGGPVTEVFGSWQKRRSELLGDTFTLCFGGEGTPSRLNELWGWRRTKEDEIEEMARALGHDPGSLLVLPMRSSYGEQVALALDRSLPDGVLSYSGGLADDFVPGERKEISVRVSRVEVDAERELVVVYGALGPARFRLADRSVLQGEEATRFPLVRPLEELRESWNFPAALPLDFAAGDLLVARYAPDLLSEEHLWGMLRSRWAYEKESSEPLGGRWFAPDAREPAPPRKSADLPRFRTVLMAAAAAIPERTRVKAAFSYSFGEEWLVGNGEACGQLNPPGRKGFRLGSIGNVATMLRNRAENKCHVEAREAEALREQCESSPSSDDCAAAKTFDKEACLAAVAARTFAPPQKVAHVTVPVDQPECTPSDAYRNARRRYRDFRVGPPGLRIRLTLDETMVLPPEPPRLLSEESSGSIHLPVDLLFEVRGPIVEEKQIKKTESILLDLSVRLLSISWAHPATGESVDFVPLPVEPRKGS